MKIRSTEPDTPARATNDRIFRCVTFRHANGVRRGTGFHSSPQLIPDRRLSLQDPCSKSFPALSFLRMHGPSAAGVVAYYNSKTESIIRKYGPGPRVHFHIGWFEPDALPPLNGLDSAQQALVQSQEKLIGIAAEVWDAETRLSGRVLDAGAGFGGGSLYWADRFSADVTAITIVPEQAEWIGRFAEVAGVAHR